MKQYLKWKEEKIHGFDEARINTLYAEGFLFGRNEKNALYQTRSLRIDLTKFELSSENRRILRKTENVLLKKQSLPYTTYSWTIGKLGKDFYTTKFGDGTFSANKIKELLTDETKSNFNTLLVYTIASPPYQGGARGGLPTLAEAQTEATPPNLPLVRGGSQTIGYCIALETNELIHYCYPFYQLQATITDKLPTTSYNLPTCTGLGMMLKAIVHAKEHSKKYIYLGSAQRPTDTYKLQFEGLEWFDGKLWKTDQEELKEILEKI